MSFQPVVPIGGLLGFRFLERTREAQQDAFDNSAVIARETAYFEDNIGKITTAEELVADRRLLSVALGAFELDEDINNRFFLRKVLEDGALKEDGLANRLSDKRYLEFTKAFGFGDFDTPRTVLSDFGAEITDAYRELQFEKAVGNQDPAMRQAIAFDRAIDEILETDTTADGLWYTIMGQPPVRSVFEAALGLPQSFGALDLGLQLKTFRERASSVLGDGEIAQFADPAQREKLVRLFFCEQKAGLAQDPLQAPVPR